MVGVHRKGRCTRMLLQKRSNNAPVALPATEDYILSRATPPQEPPSENRQNLPRGAVFFSCCFHMPSYKSTLLCVIVPWCLFGAWCDDADTYACPTGYIGVPTGNIKRTRTYLIT